jgi:glycosyltransferase involved in cell wall biosynthesis
MKIIYISPIHISAPKGDSIHFLEIGENLGRFGHELLVICRGEKEKPCNLNVKYIPNLEVKYITTILTEFWLSLYLVFYVLVFKPDIIYCRAVTLGGIISRIFRIPSVTEANGIYPDEIKMERPRFFRFAGFLLKLRERTNYISTNRIICVTEGIKRELVKNYGVDGLECRVIPNGVNTGLFKPLKQMDQRRALGFEEGCFYVGFIGSFQPWQGLDILVDAIKVVKEREFNRIRCFLVGDGDVMDQVKGLISRYDLGEEIILKGRVDYKDVPLWINSFDICVAPFKKERNAAIGLSPLKIYEYMACGKPVIASRVEGVGEMISEGHCGYLFEPDSPEDLASAIVKSYEEKSRLNEMGRHGRMFVESRFSWETIGRRVEGVLREALDLKSEGESLNRLRC